MDRSEMVKARIAELEKLDDFQLVDTVLEYFKQNATLPGQKRLKTFAQDLKAEFDGKAIQGMLPQMRKELIKDFASILVREVHLKNVRAMNANKPNRDKAGCKMKDLTDTGAMAPAGSESIPINGTKDSYTMPVHIKDGSVYPSLGRGLFKDEALASGAAFAQLPGGFLTNHKALDGMEATVVAGDYSGGKFANMSYRLLIDLGQAFSNLCAPAQPAAAV